MITEKHFIELINNYQNWNKQIDAFEDVLNNAAALRECSIFMYTELLFDQLLNAYFTEEGVDWVYWWLFDRPTNHYSSANINRETVPADTVEDLWNIVKEHII